MQFDKDLNSDQAEIFLDVRAFIIKEIDLDESNVIEKFTDNITSYYSKEYEGGFCYIKTKDGSVHIGWFKGASIDDKPKQLFGKSKVLKGQKIELFNDLQKKAVKFYIEQTKIILLENYEKKLLKKLHKN